MSTTSDKTVSRRWWHWLIWSLSGVFATVVLLVVAIWFWWQRGAAEQRLENMLSVQLGTEVQLQGELELDLWPHLSLRAEGLSVAHPRVRGKQLIHVQDGQIEMGWREILTRNFGAAALQAEQVDISLDTDEQGWPELGALLQLLPDGDSGGSAAGLPELSISRLQAGTFDSRWQLSLEPVQIHAQSISDSELKLTTPFVSMTGPVRIGREGSDGSQLKIGAEGWHVEIPYWPKTGSLSFEGRIRPAESAVKVAVLRFSSNDQLSVKGKLQVQWAEPLNAEASLQIVMQNSLAPLRGIGGTGGAGPELSSQLLLQFKDKKLGAEAEGVLGEATFSLSAAGCLPPVKQAAVQGELTRLSPKDWVLPDQGAEDDQTMEIPWEVAAEVSIDELLDGDVRATDMRLAWRSHNATVSAILLECEP